MTTVSVFGFSPLLARYFKVHGDVERSRNQMPVSPADWAASESVQGVIDDVAMADRGSKEVIVAGCCCLWDRSNK